MPRFVILRHEQPEGVHYDFMLESAGALKTWSLPQPPDVGGEISCKALPDHRTAYLDYEGPVAGDRGVVTRWDRGTYAATRETDAEWIVELSGEKLAGIATLRREVASPGGWAFSLAGG